MSDLRVYKYPLFNTKSAAVEDVVKMSFPPTIGGQHVAMQDGWITLWAIVDADAAPTARIFQFVGTGQFIPPNASYIGVVFDRSYVWTVFELVKP